MTHRLELTVADETWERLEAVRGHEPRASFVKRALESALIDSSGAPGPVRASVSSRAPVEKETVRRAERQSAGSSESNDQSAAPSRPAHNSGWNRVTRL